MSYLFCSCSLWRTWRRMWREVIGWRLQTTVLRRFTPSWGSAGSRNLAGDLAFPNWERNSNRRRLNGALDQRQSIEKESRLDLEARWFFFKPWEGRARSHWAWTNMNWTYVGGKSFPWRINRLLIQWMSKDWLLDSGHPVEPERRIPEATHVSNFCFWLAQQQNNKRLHDSDWCTDTFCAVTWLWVDSHAILQDLLQYIAAWTMSLSATTTHNLGIKYI